MMHNLEGTERLGL